ncbi:hypothetical protein BOX15_Mlig032021g3 [Macrostomum lignano]|uniref:J domain-containing protein n=2 Tax=Macrostomum lignano TaxID=282301 RepID=A0A267E3R0_9PLAT|nr:hypothetical protein BOX15_Mlig032021g3 [Macrostomum lignano]
MIISKEEAAKILCVLPDASETEIKSAYRRLALQYHPDKCLPEEQEAATKKFQEISLAYKKLTSTDDEVDRLKDKFMNPEFIWLLIDAMTRTDFSVLFFFMNHSEDVDDFYCDDEDEDYSDDSDSSFNDNPNWYEYYQYRRQYRDQNSPITRFSTLSPEEAEKQAKELIEAEEREKRRAQRKQEKRRKKRQRRGKKKQEQQQQQAAAADLAAKKQAATDLAAKKQAAADLAAKKQQQEKTAAAAATAPVKSHGRKDSGEGGQQLGATAATDDSKDQDACSGSSGEDSSTGDIEEEEFDEASAFVARRVSKNQLPQQQQKPSQKQQQAPTQQPSPPRPTPRQQPPQPPPRQQPPQPPPRQQPPQPPPRQQPPAPAPQPLMQLNIPEPSPSYSTDPKLEARQRAKEGNRLMSTPLEDFSAAAVEFAAAIRLDPTDCRYYGSRAACYYRLGQLDLCASDAKQSVQLSPQYVKGFYILGQAQADLGLHAEAANSFSCVVALDADGCGDALERMRESQLACLEKSLGLDRGLCSRALDLANGDIEAAANRLLAGAGLPEQQEQRKPLSPPVRGSYAKTAASAASTSRPVGVLRPRNSQQPQPSANSSCSIDDEDQSAAPKRANCLLRSPPKPLPGATPDNPNNCRSLWVGSVKADVTEAQLRAAFIRYGPVLSLKMVHRSCYAFVNMATPQAAAAARAGLNGQVLGSHKIVVRYQI